MVFIKHCLEELKDVIFKQSTGLTVTNSSIFLNIGDTFGPRVVLGAFCHSKPPYMFILRQKHHLIPPTGGQKITIILEGRVIA